MSNVDEIAALKGRVAALENIVYKKDAAPVSIEQILESVKTDLRDRLVAVNENEVRAKEYFHNKDDWNTVNKLLRQHGFQWVSQGKESHWSRQ